MRYLLRDLTPGQEYAIQFRSNTGEQVSDWSQVQRFTTTDDVIAPSPVQNLTWYDSGSSFIAQWDKVITQATTPPSPLRDFRNYHLNISDGSTSKDYYTVSEKFDYTKEMNASDFGSVKTSLTIKVWAVDMTYNESVVTTANANPSNPPTPSTPTIGVYLGLLYAQWDGKTAGGAAMPTNTMYAEVHVSTTNNFTPSASTFVGRVEVLGSASKMVVPGLVYNTQYFVKLIAVNELLKKSSPSAQASGTPVKLSGLDIQNNQISSDQINFTARDIGGANAYYSTSQPQSGVNGVGTLRTGDVWYDTDDKYTTYKHNGTTWVLAPEIGFVAGTKIVAGTLTADAVGTNLIIASSANIATAAIDQANIASVNAASIRTGSIQANQRIIAGPELENHAEMTSTGFYVKGPQPGTPTGQIPIIIDRIRMGTGVSDFFAIPDPIDPESTLAQISEDGGASFQTLNVEYDPTITGKKLIGEPNVASHTGNGNTIGAALDPKWLNRFDSGATGTGLFSDRVGRMVANASAAIYGLEAGGSQGIRDEYGLAQFRVPVIKGKVYQIHWTVPTWYQTVVNGETIPRLREQRDERTVAQQIANPNAAAATQATLGSRVLDQRFLTYGVAGRYVTESYTTYWTADYTGYTNMAISIIYNLPQNSDAVLKVANGAGAAIKVWDMGPAEDPVAGQVSNMGGSLYAYTTPPPPPPPATQQYYGEWRYNWVRSYKGGGGYMSNGNGRAYQGVDPSGYNGNQVGFFGFQGLDFTTLGPTIDRIVVYLYFAHWYYNAGGTARIGYHSQWNDPGGAGQPSAIGNTFDSGGWPKPGGRELDITGWRGNMINGSFRGIALGPGNNGSQNYGYATDCVLKVWYTK